MHVPVGIALDPLMVQPFSSSIWLVSQSLYVYALSDDTSHLVCLFVSRQAQVRETHNYDTKKPLAKKRMFSWT